MKKIDKFIIYTLLIAVFFLRYLRVSYEAWYVLDVLLLLYIFINGVKIKRENLGFYFWNLVSLAFLGIIISINISMFGFGKVFLDNILMTFTPITLLMYVSYLTRTYSIEILMDIGRKILVFLNVYFWFNVPIIALQFLTGSFMMERFLSWGMFNFDHMTGLIGAFGTGILNVFWASLLMGNLFIYMMTKEKKWIVGFWLQIPTMLILSYFNENKAFIPTLIIFLVIGTFYIFIYKKVNFKSVLKLCSLIMLSIVVGIVMYHSIEMIQVQVDQLFTLASDFGRNAALNTHNERAYLNYLAFHYYDAGTLGIGINTVDFQTQTIHKNLGINSFSLIIIHGGLWYYLAVLNIYVLVAVSIIKRKFDVGAFFLYVTIFILFGFLSFITQPFRDHYLMWMVAMFFFYLSIFLKKKGSLEEK